MSIEKNDDVCEACGVLVELGSVIHEDDNVLSLPIAASDQAQARVLADKLISQAKDKYADCEIEEITQGLEAGVVLQLNIRFSCTAERLIFEMALR
ncbi:MULTISPECIES: DUF406 family protein [unclassified Motilimonas]|uniref:DUF406 family protein n=1 Tax=Motilimonas TaxID=1914248 RepID=UPI001E35F5C9|nr:MULTISPECIES: DUF406 family protein [unclassified Motilimonas]MCE0557682.1 YfcZ/YiiS family protein [Motilimonas sp. E26]MDO6527201.1 DUF406 family protein [Motilimonas sp. 1_MG-2023]